MRGAGRRAPRVDVSQLSELEPGTPRGRQWWEPVPPAFPRAEARGQACLQRSAAPYLAGTGLGLLGTLPPEPSAPPAGARPAARADVLTAWSDLKQRRARRTQGQAT